MQWARIGGAVGTIYTASSKYTELRNAGVDQARAAVLTLFGYDISPNALPEHNTMRKIGEKLLGTYWPAIAGEGIHQVFGNPKGAFNSGIGFKFNRSTPKGMNL